MGRLFLEHLGGERIFVCATPGCNCYLTNRALLASTRFTGATGRAFLFVDEYEAQRKDVMELYGAFVRSIDEVAGSGVAAEDLETDVIGPGCAADIIDSLEAKGLVTK